MRIKAEEFTAGQYYHIYNHACGKELLFQDEEDYLKCLALIERYYFAADYRIICYCLMPNHYHFLIHQISDIPAYMYFNKIWFSYSKYFNQKYSRKGSIFGGRLQHIGIRSNEYLMRLCAYIHRNPLEAKLVRDVKNWQWSDYAEWMGLRKRVWVDTELIDSRFPQPGDYVEFVRNFEINEVDYKSCLD